MAYWKKFAPIQKVSPSQSCSHRNSVQNGPIEGSTALMATLFVKKYKIDPDPKKCRHHKVVRTEILCRMHRSRNSQLSRWPFSWKIINLTQIQKKCRRHKVVCTEILCRMHQSRAPQLLRGPLSWPFPCLCLGATFQQTSGNLWTAFGQLVDNIWATFGNQNGR